MHLSRLSAMPLLQKAVTHHRKGYSISSTYVTCAYVTQNCQRVKRPLQLSIKLTYAHYAALTSPPYPPLLLTPKLSSTELLPAAFPARDDGEGHPNTPPAATVHLCGI